MLYGDGAEILIGARKFRHDIGGKCEQRDKNKNDSPLDDTERSEDVSLAGTSSLNHGEVIWTHGMEKMINCVELCGIHLVYTPNQRGGGDDTGFQLIIVTPGHGDDPRCVCRRPIVKSSIRRMEYGVVVMSLERGVLGNLVGSVIGRARGGGVSVMVVFLYFLYVAMLFFWERETGEGGEIRKVQYVEHRPSLG
jgi:hypothetical protein